MAGDRGFTLTELVIVIVIMAIVSTISVRFIQFSTQGAIDTSERQQLAAAGGIISEILSREIREALPVSIRTRQGGRCVELIPILAGGRYQGQLKESHSEFTTLGDSQGPVTGRVVVYPYSASPYELFTPGSVSSSVATWDGSQVSYTDGETQRFAAESPRSRFFMVAGPLAFCRSDSGGLLERYDNYALDANFTTGDSTVVATGLVTAPASPLFRVEEASLTRNALVVINLELAARRGNETYQLSQEVQIRNVP
ncbi:MAG: prepilin-type N-terminal cleavage/methylation domain-containing protein [Halomonadaceae bacterium]|nr:MAG: prepilin-type N-terminal cleavage/methylation domain-containing protein [Halomonadaceae bacterium]